MNTGIETEIETERKHLDIRDNETMSERVYEIKRLERKRKEMTSRMTLNQGVEEFLICLIPDFP